MIASACRVSLVHDPDNLFSDEILRRSIMEAGFDLVSYQDSLQFRLDYERGFRSSWDRGEPTPALVVLFSRPSSEIPWDLTAVAGPARRNLRFRLSDVIPRLAPSAVRGLPTHLLDTLLESVERIQPGNLGERATRDFILREVFDLKVAGLDNDSDLLSQLVKLHLRAERLPDSLAGHIIETIEEKGRFAEWPLSRLVMEPQFFFAFLQERWGVFIARSAYDEGGGVVAEAEPIYGMQTPGPTHLPFDHPTLQAQIALLFVLGRMTAIEGEPLQLKDRVLRIGIRGAAQTEPCERFGVLTARLSDSIPAIDATHTQWLAYAAEWAEWGSLRYSPDLGPADRASADGLWGKVDAAFRDWMLRNYANLLSLPPYPAPVALHQVLPFLRRQLHASKSEKKAALLVLDGMAWAQWSLLRPQVISKITPSAKVQESGVFALVPTITPVSRQALYAGMLPSGFPESIRTTAQDAHRLVAFWGAEGDLPAHAVAHLPPKLQETDDKALARLRTCLENPVLRFVGMTVGNVDEMAHGSTIGLGGLHAQLSHWGTTSWLSDGIKALMDRGFEVWITSDHGNTQCVGTGKPQVGVVADERGERVHVFDDDALRRNVASSFPDAIIWPTAGLPASYLPLVSRGATAFTTQGKLSVSHGGISLEEVIVPLICIRSA